MNEEQGDLKSKIRHLEKELFHSRLLAETAFEGVAILENGIIIDHNKKLENILKCSSSELLGKHINSYIIPTYRTTFIDTLQNQENTPREIILQCCENTEIVVEFNIRAVNYEGHPLRIVAFHDISRRKDMERSLDITRLRYENLIDNLPVGVYRDTPGSRGVFLEVNDAMIDIFEADTREDFFSISVSDLYVNPEDRVRYSNKLEKDGEVHGELLQLKSIKGRHLWCHVSAKKMTDRLGRVYFDGVILDVSRRVEAENSLKLVESRYRNMIDVMDIGFMLLDRHRLCIEVNDSLARLLGRDRYDILGKHPIDLVERERREDFTSILDEIFHNGRGTLETEILRTDGLRLSVIFRFGSVRAENGEPLYCFSFVTDISERKKTEKILKESEERYRNLFEKSKAIELIIDPDTGGILDANEAACRYYGYEREIFTTMMISDINILNQEEVYAEMKRAREEKRNHFFFRHRLATGEIRDVEVHSGPLQVKGKQYLYSIIHDITERKKTERELQSKEAYIRAVLNAMPSIVVVTDGDYLHSANRSFFTFFGYDTLEDFRRDYKCICDLFLEGEGYLTNSSDISWVEQVLKNWREKKDTRVRMWNTKKNIESIFLVRIDFFEGDSNLYLVSFTDITDMENTRLMLNDAKKHLEELVRRRTWDLVETNEALFESQERLKEAQTIAHMGNWNWVPDKKVFEISEELSRLFGIREYVSEIPEDEIFSKIPRSEQDLYIQLVNNATDGATIEFEHRYYHPDGNEHIFHIHCATSTNDEGKIVRVFGTSQDVTEKVKSEIEKRALEEENKAQEQLLIQQSRMAAMGEMIGAIAHQWKQPLNGLSLLVQDLEDADEFGELDSEYIRDFVKRSDELILFMSSTVDEFRNFFKPSKKPVRFDVVYAVMDVVRLISVQFQSHSIEVVFPGEHNHDDIVFGYPNEFKQVIINILSNSKDAITDLRKKGKPDHMGRIIIDIKHVDSEVEIAIQDNGNGIPENILPEIFEPYVSSKGDKGTGIGLSLSRTIIKKMNGSIIAQNNETGALMVIRLPLAMEEG